MCGAGCAKAENILCVIVCCNVAILVALIACWVAKSDGDAVSVPEYSATNA